MNSCLAECLLFESPCLQLLKVSSLQWDFVFITAESLGIFVVIDNMASGLFLDLMTPIPFGEEGPGGS